MIHPGECEESPCIAGIYELQLGNSHHIWVFIYAYSYINGKLGHSASFSVLVEPILLWKKSPNGVGVFFLAQVLYEP